MDSTATGAMALDGFQEEALRFLTHADGRAVIADPMGARKTATTLSWLAHEPCGQVLVVAPSSVHGHWSREAGKWYPEVTAHHGRGSRQRRLNTLAALKQADTPAMYVTTYAAMVNDQHDLRSVGFGTVVFDEGHHLKGRTTQSALVAARAAKLAKHCIILTGTPVLNHASELWQYLHMLAPGVYKSFWKWAHEHFIIQEKWFGTSRFPTKIIHGYREGHLEIVRKQIEPFFLQRDLEDLFPGEVWIEEPEHVEISVELKPAERKAYDNLVKNSWAVIDGNEIVADRSITLSTRLNQLISDWSGLGADTTGTKVDTAVELILDLLERDEPVLVFVRFKATINSLVTALARKGVGALPYHGDLSAEARDHARELFAARKCLVLIGTLQAMGESVDGLQAYCNTMVMIDRWWTPALNDQAFGRLRRSGQLRRVSVYHVFAERTIDETITAACIRKVDLVNALRGKDPTPALYGRLT